MTGDPNHMQQLRHTILWMELRRFVVEEGQADFFQLDTMWPDGTVPRQQEVAELLQRNRRLAGLVLSLLERLAASGNNVSGAVAQAVALGMELPEKLLEKVR